MKPALFYTSLTILLVMQGLGLWWWYHVSPNNVGQGISNGRDGAFVILNIAFITASFFLINLWTRHPLSYSDVAQFFP